MEITLGGDQRLPADADGVAAIVERVELAGTGDQLVGQTLEEGAVAVVAAVQKQLGPMTTGRHRALTTVLVQDAEAMQDDGQQSRTYVPDEGDVPVDRCSSGSGRSSRM